MVGTAQESAEKALRKTVSANYGVPGTVLFLHFRASDALRSWPGQGEGADRGWRRSQNSSFTVACMRVLKGIAASTTGIAGTRATMTTA